MLTEETIDFLTLNRLHDSREWFRENHKTYERVVRAPFLELHGQLLPCAQAIDEDIQPQASRVISRINRDIRFTKDKASTATMSG